MQANEIEKLFLELCNTRNENEFQFHNANKNANYIVFFCIFQYSRENVLNDTKNESKHKFENRNERVETKGLQSTQTSTAKLKPKSKSLKTKKNLENDPSKLCNLDLE